MPTSTEWERESSKRLGDGVRRKRVETMGEGEGLFYVHGLLLSLLCIPAWMVERNGLGRGKAVSPSASPTRGLQAAAARSHRASVLGLLGEGTPCCAARAAQKGILMIPLSHPGFFLVPSHRPERGPSWTLEEQYRQSGEAHPWISIRPGGRIGWVVSRYHTFPPWSLYHHGRNNSTPDHLAPCSRAWGGQAGWSPAPYPIPNRRCPTRQAKPSGGGMDPGSFLAKCPGRHRRRWGSVQEAPAQHRAGSAVPKRAADAAAGARR